MTRANRGIRVGELVMVVHTCCGQVPMGRVRVVSAMRETAAICDRCMHVSQGTHATASGDGWWPIAWLKRIDPPAIPESVTTDSEITA